MVIADQKLLGVAEDARAAVDVRAEITNADRRRHRIAETDLVRSCNVVVEPQACNAFRSASLHG